MSNLKIVGAILAGMLLAGCSTPFLDRELDATTGLYVDAVEVKPADVKVAIPFDRINEVKFVLLRVDRGINVSDFEDFFRRRLTEYGFPQVVNDAQFAQLVIDAGLTDVVVSLSDSISLYRAAEIFGPFLIVESTEYLFRETFFHQTLRVIEPSTTTVHFDLKRERTNWLGYDSEIAYPIQNALKAWIDASRALKQY